MGDSCTEFSDYPRLLVERLSADHPEREIVGLKLAVGGWSSFQGLQQMKRDVVSLRPRVVTLYYGWNDHWIGFGVEDKEVLPSHQMATADDFASSAGSADLQGSAGPAGASERRSSQASHRERLPRESAADRGPGASARHRAGALDGSHLASVRQRARQTGGAMARDRRELVPLHRAYVAIVRELAESERAILCDLAAKFDEVPRGAERRLFLGRWHPSLVEGNPQGLRAPLRVLPRGGGAARASGTGSEADGEALRMQARSVAARRSPASIVALVGEVSERPQLALQALVELRRRCSGADAGGQRLGRARPADPAVCGRQATTSGFDGATSRVSPGSSFRS